MITAMLFAGGSGVRMLSSDLPKQFLEVGGKPIIIRTMEHFSNHPMVDAIVIACKEDWMDYLKEIIKQFNVPKVKAIVPGGPNGCFWLWCFIFIMKPRMTNRISLW